LDSIAGKRELTGRTLALLKRVGDPVERSLYLQRLARLVNVEERVLLEALAREPVRRIARLAPVPVGPVSEPAIQGLAPLEREALKQQINQLGREKADLNKAMESPAQAVGARRN